MRLVNPVAVREARMNNRITNVFALALLLCSLQAAAQWTWRDENGRLVFSDQPPPALIKPDQIVRQPTQPAGATPADLAKTTNAAASPSTTKVADKPGALRPKDQQKQEAENKLAGQSASELRERNCERARRYLRALETGQRVAIPDAQGNPVVLDDAARAEEIAQVRKNLESC
jgi:hypothetical protein